MSRKHVVGEQLPAGETNAETLVLSHPFTPEPSASGAHSAPPAVAMVPGHREGATTEAQSLLHTRLSAVSLILLIGYCMYLVRNVFLDSDKHGYTVWVLHVLMVFLNLGVWRWLKRVDHRPLKQLRWAELLIFGSSLVFFVVIEVTGMISCCRIQDQIEAVATMKDVVIMMFMLIVLYGLFIPNTWQRAARVVLPMALLPPLISLFVHVVSPEMRTFYRSVANFERISDNVILLSLGAVIAIYGSHVLNQLRHEVHLARRFGSYQLRSLLGKGGMGEVYLAEHCLLKRPSAIKLIRPEAAGHPGALARFEREVKSTAKLSHPNTIEIYDYGRTDEGTFYYVMEYLRGLSLTTLVDRHGPLPPARVIYLLRQACGALNEAHHLGLVHRDLKPGNLFAARRGGMYDFVKVLDFGLVKAISPEPENLELSHDGMVKGSPLYMSPEQAMGGQDLDGRSDLYALAAVGYYLLTGSPPFEGRSAVEVMVAHARDPVVPLTKVRHDVPRDLEDVLLRCLSKKPADRYVTAWVLEQALASCRCASEWDSRKAQDWWQTHEPAYNMHFAGVEQQTPLPA